MKNLRLPSFVLIFTTMVTIMVFCVNEEDWQRYLDQRYHNINHFSEMLRRKTDQYHSKRDDYSNWLVNYRETEREDRHTRSETDDEQLEQQHETQEGQREKHREHSHNMGRHMIEKRSVHQVLQPWKEAKQFLKYRRWNV